jgi:hypothetical protein
MVPKNHKGGGGDRLKWVDLGVKTEGEGVFD